MISYKSYIDEQNDPIYIAISLAGKFFTLGLFLILEETFYLIFFAFFTIVLSFVLIKSLYLFNKLKVPLEEEQKNNEYTQYKEALLKKYKNLDKSFFEKVEYIKSLVENRFGSDLLKERFNEMIDSSVSIFIQNIDVMNEMTIAGKHTNLKYDFEKNKLYDENNIILNNLDSLVNELILEKKNKIDYESVIESFYQNIKTYQNIKGASI